MGTRIRLAIRYSSVPRPGAVRLLQAGEEPIEHEEFAWPPGDRKTLVRECKNMARRGLDEYNRRIGRDGLRALGVKPQEAKTERSVGAVKTHTPKHDDQEVLNSVMAAMRRACADLAKTGRDQGARRMGRDGLRLLTAKP